MKLFCPARVLTSYYDVRVGGPRPETLGIGQPYVSEPDELIMLQSIYNYKLPNDNNGRRRLLSSAIKDRAKQIPSGDTK